MNSSTQPEDLADDATFASILRARRSARSYAPVDVPDALVYDVLDLTRHAPSSQNSQPWCFVVLRDRQLIKRLVRLKNACATPSKRAYRADFLHGAPVVVAVCVDKRRESGRARENGVIAAAHLQLAAQSFGLSSVYLTAYQAQSPRLAHGVRELLALPGHMEPVAFIPLGFAAGPMPAKPLRPLGEIVFRERYGQPLWEEGSC